MVFQIDYGSLNISKTVLPDLICLRAASFTGSLHDSVGLLVMVVAKPIDHGPCRINLCFIATPLVRKLVPKLPDLLR